MGASFLAWLETCPGDEVLQQRVSACNTKGVNCSPLLFPENLSTVSSIFGEGNGRTELDSCGALEFGKGRGDGYKLSKLAMYLWDCLSTPSLG